MRNLLALVGMVVIFFAAVGWYMNWYSIGLTKTADGNLRVETEVDTRKVVQDVEAKARQVGALASDQLNKVQVSTPTTPAATPTPAAPAPADTGGFTLFGHTFTPTVKK